MNIGENIKKYRKNKNISQQKLSELSGVPRVSISRYENGDRIPNINVVTKLSNALGVSIENLTYTINTASYSNNKFFDFNSSDLSSPTLIDENKAFNISADISQSKAKESLNNLVLCVKKDSKYTDSIDDEHLDNLLNKVYDLIEFELFKISKQLD